MASDADNHQTAADQLIRQARLELQLARNQMFEEMVEAGVQPATRREVAVATLKLWDALYEERDNSAVSDQWEDSGAQRLPELLNKTVPVEVATPGRGANRETRERSALVNVSIQWLDEVSQEVKEIANALGKGPNVTEATTSNEPDIGDLRGLVKSRGQSEALEGLPGGDD